MRTHLRARLGRASVAGFLLASLLANLLWSAAPLPLPNVVAAAPIPVGLIAPCLSAVAAGIVVQPAHPVAERRSARALRALDLGLVVGVGAVSAAGIVAGTLGRADLAAASLRNLLIFGAMAVGSAAIVKGAAPVVPVLYAIAVATLGGPDEWWAVPAHGPGSTGGWWVTAALAVGAVVVYAARRRQPQ